MKLLLSFAVLAFSLPAIAYDHAAHVHGVAKLEVAVEGADLNLHLESPLEGLLGFERAPRNDKERVAVAAMRQKLAEGSKLFAPTSAAQCSFVSVQVDAPTLDVKPAAGRNEHGDLDAYFHFNCSQPAKLSGVEVRLSDAFPKLRRIDAQVVSETGQKALRLSSKIRFLSW